MKKPGVVTRGSDELSFLVTDLPEVLRKACRRNKTYKLTRATCLKLIDIFRASVTSKMQNLDSLERAQL